jgi:hypothetical protein
VNEVRLLQHKIGLPELCTAKVLCCYSSDDSGRVKYTTDKVLISSKVAFGRHFTSTYIVKSCKLTDPEGVWNVLG